MADNGPPVPEDLKAKGWRTKQSRGHPGHFYYYHVEDKKSFWKLSQAYAYAELLRRNEEKNKLKLASCAKDALRVVSIGLVVLGLMTSFFISFVCYNDDLNVFNISMVCISGFVVVVHTVMAPWLLDNAAVLLVYVPVAFLIWLYETWLFVFAFIVQDGDGTAVQSELAELDAEAGGGFMGQFSLTPTFSEAMATKGKLILALAVLLNAFQFLACWFANSRQRQLRVFEEDGDNSDNYEAQRLNVNATKSDASGAAAQRSDGQKDQTDVLMDVYDSLFRQYGIDHPEVILDNDSVSSSDTITTNNHDYMSVGSRQGRKSRSAR